MKINKKFLSIPPYISTTWEAVDAIRVEEGTLVVTLNSREQIHVPDLSSEDIFQVFGAHLEFMESKAAVPVESSKQPTSSLRFGFSTGNGAGPELANAMQHNPALASAPDLPSEVLCKIASIARIMAPEGVELPEPEPHCNCPYCQIAGAIHGREKQLEPIDASDEDVTEDDLRFEQWKVVELDHNRYSVTNKLDVAEEYMVYLGEESVGCNCGRKGCDHVVAVLNS